MSESNTKRNFQSKIVQRQRKSFNRVKKLLKYFIKILI